MANRISATQATEQRRVGNSNSSVSGNVTLASTVSNTSVSLQQPTLMDLGDAVSGNLNNNNNNNNLINANNSNNTNNNTISNSNNNNNNGNLRTMSGGGGGGGGISRLSALHTSNSKLYKTDPMAKFHPKLITAQIISLQCFQYLGQSILIQINYLLLNIPVSIDRIFTDRYLLIWDQTGWPDCMVLLFSALLGSVGLVLIVEKSKKCLDFTVTYFLLHLLLSTIYNGGHIPGKLEWWIVHILAMIIMVVLGEYLCSLKELEMIPLLSL